MPRWAAKILFLLSVPTVTGCGTMGNLSGHDHIYGGTVIDGTAVVDVYQEVAHPPESGKLTIPQLTAMTVCSCIDLPLSIVGDTLTLPVTVPVTCYHWWKGSSEPTPAQEVGAAKPSTTEYPTADAPPAEKSVPDQDDPGELKPSGSDESGAP